MFGDETIVLNPSSEPLTPAEEGLLAFENHRQTDPVILAWTAAYSILDQRWKRSYYCWLEWEVYLVELNFVERYLQDDSSADVTTVPGVDAVVFRTDKATVSTYEGENIPSTLLGTRWQHSPHSRDVALRGELQDRPLIWGVPIDSDATSDHFGHVSNWNLLPKETVVDMAPAPIPPDSIPITINMTAAQPSKKRAQLLADLRDALWDEQRKLWDVRRWISAKARLQHCTDPFLRRECEAIMRYAEIKHGKRQVTRLAGYHRSQRDKDRISPEERLTRCKFHLAGRTATLEASLERLNELLTI